ncbi:hypothetical protein [Bacillus taeanensis]|uniref:Abortive phage infection protein n=1 Tax=Bacillus taeanensis TaxID=273032 RepID=A0A366XYI7_9BACI|nr:hypothetical protein [Bacillus taeanensis]RBW71212.1 hypothetical protein DS031_00195 [Bacillus taeanensis]
MTEQEAHVILDELRNGSIEEYRVGKEDFLFFRTQLTAQKDFMHFSGRAEKGGSAVYTYSETPRK